MTQNMFCFQCEQTAGGKGCTGCAGVCGKKADTAHLQDQLTGALIMLASQAKEKGAENATIDKLILEGLFSTLTNVNFNNETVKQMTDAIHSETRRIGGTVCDYDMQKIWQADEDVRSLKSLILFGIRGVAAYAYHAEVLGYQDKTVNTFFYKALSALKE
ncbi:MAG: hydroxylamine reductase, partial [Peptococcaceae bacterium]|nr:hydroxylamine reductase [Peptococcaceae bacterium]